MSARAESSLREALHAIWAEVLELEGLDDGASFFDLGGDSVLALHLATECHAAGLPVTPALLFENDTVSSLAGALSRMARPASRSRSSR